jgi:dTDP-4-dehydrorhamnose reductase
METILVTGASGFLGRYVLRAATGSYETVGIYNKSDIFVSGVTAVQVNLTDPPFESLRGFDPDHVVHCAGLVDVDECERQPESARQLNVEVTEHVANLASEVDATFTYVSTDAVFDGSRPYWSEDDKPNPINVYGRTKFEGERAAAQIHDDVTVVRTNFFGWTHEGASLSEWMLATLESGDELTGFEDVYFTPMYAGDLARYLLNLLDLSTPEVVHLGGSERLSKYAFAHEIADVFECDSDPITPISVENQDLDAPRGKDLSLDVSLAESLLGERLPDVETGLERMRAEVER